MESAELLRTMGTDGKIWAREWLKVIKEHPGIPTDEGAMIGWFANAIEAGYSKAQRELSVPDPQSLGGG